MKALIALVILAILGLVVFFAWPRLSPLISAGSGTHSVLDKPINVSPAPKPTPEKKPAPDKPSLTSLLNPKPSISITGPTDNQLEQGKTYEVTWSTTGVDRVRVVAVGTRTTYPGRDRGQDKKVIVSSVPTSQDSAHWKVPFLDTIKLRIIAKGLDSKGKVKAVAERPYTFRPDIFATRTADGIYLDLRDEHVQRLYVLKNKQVSKAYLVSGANSGAFYPPNIHPKRTHDHPGVYHVQEKYPLWHSKDFDVDMPWAMRYVNGHFIHATSPNLYRLLGTAASHGCNRLTREQAKELYDATPVGTRVEIIAK